MPYDIEAVFEEYKTEYSLATPAPKRKEYRARLPVQFWLFLPVAFLGPVVSGLRTATVFERASGTTGLADWAPMAVAIMGTLVVELGVVGFQIERLRRLAEGKRSLPPASERWIIVGLICAFGTALVSNLDVVFLDALASAEVSVPPWIEPLLVGLFLGAGVPVLALVAGEIVGRMIVEVQAANAREERHYRKDLQAWQASLKTSWDRVKKKRLAATTGWPVVSGKKPIRPVVATSDHVSADRTSDQMSTGRTSQAMADHLATIKRALADQWQAGKGDGMFKRKQVETWCQISRTQAQNVLQYGLDRSLLTVSGRNRSSYKYSFLESEDSNA